jgi:hypothetical protein
MKPFLFLAVLLAAFFCFTLNSRLERSEMELAALREKARAAEEQHAAHADLDTAREDLLEAEKKILELEDELKNSQGQVNTLTERVTAMENQPSSLLRPAKPKPVLAVKPGLIKGGFSLMGENVVYMPDSQYRLGPDLFVMSPKGMMMSDRDQQIFGGDLLLQTSQGTIRGDDAVLEVNGDNATLTAKQVTVTLKKSADSSATGATQPATTGNP